MSKHISRRNFLRIGLAGTAASLFLPALAGCTAPAAQAPAGPIKLRYWNPASSQPSMDAVLKPKADQWASTNKMALEFVKVGLKG